MHLQYTYRHEAEFIRKIVDEISRELCFINSSIDGKLIGMESRVRDVVSSLKTGVDNVRIIGIKGMGGGGKTTLARAVFDKISIDFEGQSFVENVREESKPSLSGLKSLQKQVLSDILNDQGITINSVHDGKNKMKKIMSGRKVLLVLDDVDNVEQLEALADEPNWFKPGSRIIITTRDEQVLLAHNVNFICDVSLLSKEEAMCLLSRYAFGRDIPLLGYEGLSSQVVRYAAGLPLTIKVLGSFLCGKNDLQWKDALERLKTIPLKATLEKLELSYMGLEQDCKEIFLDVACILKGEQQDKAIQVLESCGFHARNGLMVLKQKSLITISKYGNLDMHDHIEEMARNIVRRLHPDDGNRHSRLWIGNEIEDILENDQVNESIQCIKLSPQRLSLKTVMSGFKNIKKLRVLYMCSRGSWNDSEVSQHFPNALQYLSWRAYPFSSLHETFQPENLVGLDMSFSSIVELWDAGKRKVFHKLRFLDLSYTKLRTLDLGLTPNLEILNLEQCTYLIELHIPGGCPKLKFLCLDYSRKLRNLDLGLTPDIETLSLVGCDLEKLHIPFQCPKLKSLSYNGSRLWTLKLGLITDLVILSLKECDLAELHMPGECPKLKSLSIDNSRLRKLKLGLSPNLETLSLGGCSNLIELLFPVGCPKLKFLNLSNSKLRNLDLGLT
nr:TMV resistance protein N-like [Tanacetum cinerariifolium]